MTPNRTSLKTSCSRINPCNNGTLIQAIRCLFSCHSPKHLPYQKLLSTFNSLDLQVTIISSNPVMPDAPMPVGTRIALHDNPNSAPVFGRVTGHEHMSNGTQMAKLELDNGRTVTVPISLLTAV